MLLWIILIILHPLSVCLGLFFFFSFRIAWWPTAGKELSSWLSACSVFFMSRNMTKPTKWLCAQRRLRSAWASAQSDQSSLCVAKDPSFLHVDCEDCEDWTDAQADLSLRWAHMPFCWFCREAAHMMLSLVFLSQLVSWAGCGIWLYRFLIIVFFFSSTHIPFQTTETFKNFFKVKTLMIYITEPRHDKTNKVTVHPSEDSDQPGHPPSLISLRCAPNG